MATWPVPGEFDRDYVAAWIGPILELACAHVRHVKSWIIAQYGMNRVEVENVMENYWLHQLLTNGCPFDAIGLIASTASASDDSDFMARRSNGTHQFGSFQYDRTVQKFDAIIRRWNTAQLPDGATFLATLPHSFRAFRDVEKNLNTRGYAFHDRYVLHLYDAAARLKAIFSFRSSIIDATIANPTSKVRRTLTSQEYDRVQSRHGSSNVVASPYGISCV
jgi:hypothetical protein